MNSSFGAMQPVAPDVASRSLRRPMFAIVTGLIVCAFLVTSVHAGKRNPRRLAVSASVEVTKVVVDHEFSLLIRIDGVYDDFQDPALGGFEVVERNSRERNVLKNGTADNYREVAFRLRPTRTGKLAIGPARALLGGKVVASSKALTIDVINPPAPTSPAEA